MPYFPSLLDHVSLFLTISGNTLEGNGGMMEKALAWEPGISNFLEEISSLSHSVVFLYFFALIAEEVLSLLAILWNSAFKWEYLSFSPLLFASLHFTAISKASSDNHCAFFHFFSMGMLLIPVSCTMS